MTLLNKNTTLDDFNTIKNIITTKYSSFSEENIKAIFVKILPDADLIKENKSPNTSGKTSHIACTSDSMNFFAPILGEKYIECGTLTSENTFDIYVETSHLNANYSTPFVKSKCTIWLSSKSSNQKNQIALSKSKKNCDGDEFKELRRKMHEDDVLIFFKYLNDKNLENYVILLSKDSDDELISQISNLKSLSKSTKKIVRNPKYCDSLYPILEVDKNLKGINKIYFGAPGTGKSKYVSDNYYNNTFAKRVTFHPEYTYNDFVGYIKPTIINDKLTYAFSPGIFTEILLDSLKDSNNMYTLIIEELNRANVSAVFGDLFQLLDRDSSGNSEYRINNLDIFNYLKSKLGDNYPYTNSSIGIPNNLNIIATMNTSDQNVFTMDTAFKRRWEFEYLKIKFDDDHEFKDNEINNLNITWQNFVETLNEFMMSIDNSDLMISEDKQIGPYFVKNEELNDTKKFGYKVLLYLWDDVFKMSRENIFNSQIRTFTELMDKFSSENAIDIFSINFRDKLNTKVISKTESKSIEVTDNE
ncbi:McrB family protein [Clostridium perfringens]